MAKRDRAEYQAKITDDAGITRAKVPSPLIRQMGARPGDFMVFRRDDEGNVLMSLSRSKGAGNKSAGRKGSKKGSRGSQTGKRR
ncbi:MAG TPA: hypothetical protein VGB17_12845 [Pyrinomonadaceae bacterium]|jgi:hypothetical protein